MCIKENEVLAHRYVDGFATGKADNAKEFIEHPTKYLVYNLYEEGNYGFFPVATGPQEYQAMIHDYHTSFPDVIESAEEPVVTEDLVVRIYPMHGAFEGEIAGIVPTGKRLEYTGMDRIEFAEGKISQVNSVFDQMGFFQQLGILLTQPST
jgi:predicted ester cyclase